MEQEILISKKQLLEKYKISYGALYRWKRKGLIPDEWFIKKATVTGQETFFPEKLVCERIEMIQNMKDDVSLDELARQLSGEEEKNECVLLLTEFGDKSFRMRDIKGIFLINGSGERREITQVIQQLFDRESEESTV